MNDFDRTEILQLGHERVRRSHQHDRRAIRMHQLEGEATDVGGRDGPDPRAIGVERVFGKAVDVQIDQAAQHRVGGFDPERKLSDLKRANLFEFQNTAKSGAKPGILTTLPIGIAVQGVTLVLLVVQGGMAGMGELSSTSTANAKRMAKELADAVETALKRVSTPR